MPNSKVKGNTAERWAAQLLTTYWGEEFKRIPSSGALRWHGSTDTYGDLLCPPSFKGVVECKHRKKFELLQALTSEPADDNILGWWQQVTDDVTRCKTERNELKVPVLVAKRNRSTPVICLPESMNKLLPQLPHLTIVNPKVATFCVYELAVFLKLVPRGILEVAIESYVGATNGLPD